MKRAVVLLGGLLLAGVSFAWWQRVPKSKGEEVRLELAPPEALPAFARALEPRPFALPRDHGPHYEFQTEWWYYTGNLSAADGRLFGFQLTFFRRGLSPGAPAHDGTLRSNQVYFAHFALTDVAAGRHRFFERFARGAGELAGAASDPVRVWLEDWSVLGINEDGSALRLRAEADGQVLDLRLAATKPLVAHGDRGLSPKSAEPGNASYYVSYPRLSAEGQLTSAGRPRVVRGEAWFDHEWSTSALGPGAVGWDWFSLRLDDGRELMYFQIRRDDGSLEPVSSGTLVARDGSARRLSPGAVRLEALGEWTSPESGARYPSAWRLSVPDEDLALEIRPWLAGQELRTSFTYWEGAVGVTGRAGARSVEGTGYVEMTGYTRSMQGVF